MFEQKSSFKAVAKSLDKPLDKPLVNTFALCKSLTLSGGKRAQKSSCEAGFKLIFFSEPIEIPYFRRRLLLARECR